MKEGYRFVDCDMHIMEPTDLFDKYLDPAFKPRITSAMQPVDGGSTGMRRRPLWFFDGTPTSNDGNISQYNRIRGPLVGARGNKNVMFAVERGYDAEAQVIGMEMEGIDIAVLFPTAGLSFLARDDMDPQFSNAICRAYNDWLHDFVQHSPDQLKMAAMLPVHDVNLACRELHRCVKEYGAVGAFVRPNYVNGRYWHSTYWDPLYAMLQDLKVPLCFHEGTGSYYSTIEPRFGENRFMRHVASHSTEMQLALIALMLGGIFESYPRLKVAFLEAQSWWVPGPVGPHRMGSAPAPSGRRALSEIDAVRILAAQLLLGDRERRARGRRGRRALGRRRQHLRVERFSAFRFELPGGVGAGVAQFQHHP
jgi:predicted TIM-barrel fold metal-dependent hydrolase